jgi:hypothetical protein
MKMGSEAGSGGRIWRQDLEAGSGALGLLRHPGAPAKSRIGYLIFMTALTDEKEEQLNLAQAIGKC